jgi:hypothetical protein
MFLEYRRHMQAARFFIPRRIDRIKCHEFLRKFYRIKHAISFVRVLADKA